MDIAILTLLLILGVAFLILEIFLLPGFGIGGVAGLGFLAASVWYAFTNMSLLAGWLTLIAGVLMLAFGIWLFLRMRILDKISLNTEIDGVATEPIQNLQVGDQGIAKTRLAPMGTVRFANVDVEVSSEDGFVDANTPVVISSMSSHHVVIRKL